MHAKCPFAPPYPSTEVELIEATQAAAAQLRECAPYCRPRLRHALLVIAHDHIKQVVEMLKTDGHIPVEERRKQCDETRARVGIIAAAHHADGPARLH